ncbi:MAG: hypothetical protein ABSC30_13100 [Acidimicrobiales bacterium]|jgi:hypothetical protein
MPNPAIGTTQALIDSTTLRTGSSISRNLVAGDAITQESTPRSAAHGGRRRVRRVPEQPVSIDRRQVE